LYNIDVDPPSEYLKYRQHRIVTTSGQDRLVAYNGEVIGALQEVADRVVSLRSLQKQRDRTDDALASLPTYSFNGPDNWTEIDPPLSAMPEF
jgi:hypothetical protein